MPCVFSSYFESSNISKRNSIPYGAPLSTDTNQFVYYQIDPRGPDEFDYYENEEQQEPAPVLPESIYRPQPQPQPTGLDEVTRKSKPTLTSSVLTVPTIIAIQEGMNITTNGTRPLGIDIKEEKSGALSLSPRIYATAGSILAVGAVFVVVL